MTPITNSKRETQQLLEIISLAKYTQFLSYSQIPLKTRFKSVCNSFLLQKKPEK